ncbi:MAG: T9SS type A sorting domain-containing protein [Bacteroidia bacterium]
MKRLLILTFLIAGLLGAHAQQAALQLIHNSPDLLAASVDIYVNGSLYADDFSFRDATAFDSVPANTPLLVGVAPATSNTPLGNGYADTIGTFGPLTLNPLTNYVVIAEGIVLPVGYSTTANSDLSFELEIIASASSSSGAGTIDVAVSHGAPDVDAVDIFANRSENALLNDVPFKASTGGFLTVPARDYIFGVARSADSTNVLASYFLEGSALGGASAVVFASGFFTTNDEPVGVAGFGLYAALANGTVVPLQLIEEGTAKAQIIHNSPDLQADVVDLYLDIISDTIKIENFAFRSATPFVDVPAGYPITVGVALENSTGIDQSIATFKPQFMADENYVIFAQGVVNIALYDTTVAGSAAAIGFELSTLTPADTNNADANNISVAVAHGATDAPAVDIFANGGMDALLNDVPYGANTGGYLDVPATEYIFGVAASADSSNILASYYIDTRPLGGGAAVIFASGFLNPSRNNNGSAFGLFAVTPDGGAAIPLTPIGSAQAQVIHNAADPAVDTVDIYLDLITEIVKLEDIGFRSATPFTTLPSGYPIKVAFAPKNSTSITDAIATIPTPAHADGAAYHVVANGVLNPMNFEVNPDNEDIGFDLYFQAAQTTGGNASNVDLSVFHGATDAPTVDVLANGGTPPLIDDITYGAFQGYASVPAADYELGITPGSDNSQVLARYLAPASGLGGRAGVILASGFFTNLTIPSSNQNGEPFGLLLVLDDGTSLMLSPVTGIENTLSSDAFSVYPNPALGPQFARLSLETNSSVAMKLMDATGRQVWNRDLGQLSAGEHSIDLKTENLPGGVYQLVVEGEGFSGIRKIMIK